MSNSFAQTLAGGTQDLAALAGLFATDGVERNALSVQSGYFAIAISSLSLLGVLGLVRSAIKVALGLRRCSNAGFNLDSLRGLYGFLPEESDDQKNRIECDFTEVAFYKNSGSGKTVRDTGAYDYVVIRRKKRFFDPQLTPIVNVGSDWPEKLYSKTVVNLGNLRREESLYQSPILIGFLLFFCPGVTAWLLLVVHTSWNEVILIATAGLHISLTSLLAVPIWHGRNMSKPGAYLNVATWNLLTRGIPDPRQEAKKKLNKLSFLHARVADGDVLHMSGDRVLLDSEIVQVFVLVPALTCAVSYVCQYAVLTKASNRQALIWVGLQAFLALVRVLFWIIDPQFDNPEGMQTEYAVFNNTHFEPATLMEMTCACSSSLERIIVPRWAWEYLLTTDLDTLLREATPGTAPPMPITDPKFCVLLDIDFERIVRRRRGQFTADHGETDLWRLGLEMLEDNTIRPFVMIEMPYLARETDPTTGEEREWLEHCWTRAVADSIPLLKQTGQDLWLIKKTCNLCVFNKQGERIHLRPVEGGCPSDCPRANATENPLAFEEIDTWRYFYDRSNKVCKLLSDHIFGQIGVNSVNTWGDALWTVATPGIVDRKGKVHPLRATTTRTWGNGIDGNMEAAIKYVGEYIGEGIHKSNVRARGKEKV
ncbi:hypothetical protein GMOD_00003565 [Pyrenophora seminiperda CCB06]|uniref:Uncharacterized protein n=1 Tax=Pyrenophora seminiperda CCB06 TaxID=1302712 RepID=A0A3M7MJ06_9PLEO|nr:hypothetical protein GMOD_00003565 [Pyrenophora seminiperda CCB06]